MECRFCKSALNNTVIDLGVAPPSNAYLNQEDLNKAEKFYPLKILLCENCWLVQTKDFIQTEELFNSTYAYFSSYSDSWLNHVESYVNDIIQRFRLGSASHVVEVASNDGYLLQYVQQAKIPCLGIEPTKSTAFFSKQKNINTIEDFFGEKLAKVLLNQGFQADLMVANNVLAHVPDINDFVRGFTILLKDNGVATFEFPHLFNMISENQFDTIYHEHYSYLSLGTACQIFAANGLNVFDVEQLSTHGGSLRIFAQRSDTGIRPKMKSVSRIIEQENALGMRNVLFYKELQANSEKIKNDLVSFLIEAKNLKRNVVGYGAAAKGNTLLNFSGIRSDLVNCVVDRNPAKQGKFMPGSRLKILDESEIRKSKPDYILILPWNIKDEVINQLEYVRQWGGHFVVAVPNLTIL